MSDDSQRNVHPFLDYPFLNGYGPQLTLIYSIRMHSILPLGILLELLVRKFKFSTPYLFKKRALVLFSLASVFFMHHHVKIFPSFIHLHISYISSILHPSSPFLTKFPLIFCLTSFLSISFSLCFFFYILYLFC